MTPKQLRSAAHALRTAASALEETVTALRALSDDLNEPDPEPDVPEWPTAPYVWWDGEVWVRGDDGEYQTAGDYWAKSHLDATVDGARRFAREAVPVTPVPTAEWEASLDALPMSVCDADRDLLAAVDSLAQEVAR